MRPFLDRRRDALAKAHLLRVVFRSGRSALHSRPPTSPQEQPVTAVPYQQVLLAPDVSPRQPQGHQRRLCAKFKKRTGSAPSSILVIRSATVASCSVHRAKSAPTCIPRIAAAPAWSSAKQVSQAHSPARRRHKNCRLCPTPAHGVTDIDCPAITPGTDHRRPTDSRLTTHRSCTYDLVRVRAGRVGPSAVVHFQCGSARRSRD